MHNINVNSMLLLLLLSMAQSKAYSTDDEEPDTARSSRKTHITLSYTHKIRVRLCIYKISEGNYDLLSQFTVDPHPMYVFAKDNPGLLEEFRDNPHSMYQFAQDHHNTALVAAYPALLIPPTLNTQDDKNDDEIKSDTAQAYHEWWLCREEICRNNIRLAVRYNTNPHSMYEFAIDPINAEVMVKYPAFHALALAQKLALDSESDPHRKQVRWYMIVIGRDTPDLYDQFNKNPHSMYKFARDNPGYFKEFYNSPHSMYQFAQDHRNTALVAAYPALHTLDDKNEDDDEFALEAEIICSILEISKDNPELLEEFSDNPYSMYQFAMDPSNYELMNKHLGFHSFAILKKLLSDSSTD